MYEKTEGKKDTVKKDDDKKVEMGIKYTYTVRAKYNNSLSWYEDKMTCTHKY